MATKKIKGVVHAQFGGYVTRYYKTIGRNKVIEVRVWLPANIDETDCGEGTAKVVEAIATKAKVDKSEVRETWRYR